MPLKKVKKNIVTNDEPYPHLLLNKDKRYNKVLLPYICTHLRKVPRTAMGCPVCFFYHSDGSCMEECSFCKSHCLLAPKLVNDCVLFLTKARNAAGGKS